MINDWIDAKKSEINEQKTEYNNSKSQGLKKNGINRKKLQRSKEAFKKLELQALDRAENKDIALAYLLFLFVRCKKWDVPIQKLYSKTQHDKFRWAIDTTTADHHFYNYESEIVLRNADDEEQQQNSDDG
ncbi:unnamed protein product [Rotaria magnacalcarata]|uniref:Topoisomerase I C-terminal domain-containing protein n=1 Tax=Rotaria magnacalcarata TaxID=392030 RepID=A0A816JXS1_9BILA|nr:unnamed protein product [Rotaria magnacalcarata]